MSDSLVTFVGNLTKDGELRFTPSGQAVYSNSIAVAKRRKVGDEWEETTSFYNLSAWGSLAENMTSLKKGTRVLVQGSMEIRPYEKDGEKRQSIDVTAEFAGPELKWATAEVEKSTAKGQGGASSSKGSSNRGTPIYGDEEPF